jgi:DNA-binding transcriptional ArsR family regulator
MTQEIPCCESTVIHEDVVQTVRAAMPADAPIMRVAELFKVFGDFTRARIICALNQAEMCVCDLSVLLSMQQSAISHQLRILKDTRLVKARKSGKVVYYSLNDEHIGQLFALAFTHVTEQDEQGGEIL